MSAFPTPRSVAVVYHTHWDREWYFSHAQFLARLERVMAQVCDLLEQGVIEHFLFDGQTAAFEDLLANAEHSLCARVRALARQGRLVIGPWYVMADEFLVSGESLIRNLELGVRDATAAGNCQRVGYLPDTFGHIAQMPQLLRGFGIDCAVLWRGADAERAEFDWLAPDGSCVGTVFLTQGYYQHPLNLDDQHKALTSYLQQIDPRSAASELLLMQGGDHLLPGADVGQRLRAFNSSQGEFRLHESTLETHVARVLNETAGRRAALSGELRSNRQAFVLPDVLSTRRYLKRMHQALEDKLTHVVEPLFAQLQVPWPERALEYCWRELIRNQAHDSICGCSVDTVHEEMETRFTDLNTRLNMLIERARIDAGMHQPQKNVSSSKGAFADDGQFTLFNPRAEAHDGAIPITIFLRGAVVGPRVTELSGTPVPSTLLRVTLAQEFHSPDDDFPDVVQGYRYELLLWANLPAFAAKEFRVERLAAVPTPASVATRDIGNEAIRVSLRGDGTLCVADLRRAIELEKCISLTHETDAGDTYNFSPLAGTAIIRSEQFSLVSSTVTDSVQTMTLRFSMRVPLGLSGSRQSVSESTVDNAGEMTIMLFAGDPRAHIRIEFDNRACDQRTRIVFRTPETINSHSSDSAFVWQQRAATIANYPSTPSRQEMTPAVFPSLSAVAAGGLYVNHAAMQEFEIVSHQGERQLALTLVRSIGWLSRRDLLTRGVGAGPDIATPGAQCLRKDHFQLAIGFADEGSLEPLRSAESLRRAPVLLRGVTDLWRGHIDVGNTAVRVSALRRISADNGARELRLWNPTASPKAVQLGPQWARVRLDGSELDAGNASLVLAPASIGTWRERAA